MKKQVKGWLDAARDDPLLVEEIIDNSHLTNMVAFHSQQAIEKTFKAVLEEHESIVPRIHNLITLHSLIGEYIHITIDMDLLQQINKLYIDTRYPSELGLLPDGKPPKETSERMYLLAREIHKTVEKRL
ncbi:MAG: HEPN domain-containing protein [Candidatus Latescibacterota bacterium]